MTASLDMDNPIFRMYLGYAALAIVKVLAMAPITAYHRIKNKAFANEEDAKRGNKTIPLNTNHPDVERVRRCHQNDIENVIFFVALGLLYVATGPSIMAATWHFRIFVISRYIHTLAYLNAVPQPARALSFFIGLVTLFSMSYNILIQASF